MILRACMYLISRFASVSDGSRLSGEQGVTFRGFRVIDDALGFFRDTEA